MVDKQVKLGDMLVQAGLIDDLQLKSALGYQRRWGGKLGKCLVDQGFIEEDAMLRFLSQRFRMQAVDLTRSRIAPQTFAMVPENVARKYEVVPVVIKETPGKRTLVLAMSDPSDLVSADEIQFLTNCKIEPVLATDSAISQVLSHYGDYSPEMITGPQWGASPAELHRRDQDKKPAPKLEQPQVVGEGLFDLSEEALESEGVGISPDQDIEIVRDEVTMIRAGMETPAPRPATPPRPVPPPRPAAPTGPSPRPTPPPKPAAPPPSRTAPTPRPAPAPPPRVPPPVSPRPPSRPAPTRVAPPPPPPPPEAPSRFQTPEAEPPELEPDQEFEIEHGAPSAPIHRSEQEVGLGGGIDLDIPEDDGGQMELAGAHEFVPVLDESQASQAGVGVEHARTEMDRSLFDRSGVASADSSLARQPADESVTEMPPLQDEFFHPPAPAVPQAVFDPEAPFGPSSRPRADRREPAPPALDLPDFELPPLTSEPPAPPMPKPTPPPPPARAVPPPPRPVPEPPAPKPRPTPAAPPLEPPDLTPAPPPAPKAPAGPPPLQEPPPIRPAPARPVPAGPPPLIEPLPQEPTPGPVPFFGPPELEPPPLSLAESTAEEALPPPVLEPHAPPVPEFDLPPASVEYEFKPESRLAFEEPPPKPAFEGDLADRPDTPDFASLAEKPLPKADLSEDEMFFNVEREKAGSEPAVGEMEKIPAAFDGSKKISETRRRLAELEEEIGDDFLDANEIKARLKEIEALRAELHQREYQFDELLGLMMKKEMGELTSELFMKELTLLKLRVEDARRKKSN